MNENLWQLAQIVMWVAGIQTTIIIAVMGAFYSNLSKKNEKTNERIDKLGEKVEDIDRRMCRIEGSLQTHGHCLFNQNRAEQQAQ